MPVSSTPYPISDYPSNYAKYPSPFFDLSRTFVPSKIKTLFKFCRVFFYKNEFINSVLYKLTEYPITDLIFKHKDQELKDKYRELFNHYLKVRTLLIEIGLDYHTFGNCFISATTKFKRYLTCPQCQHTVQISEQKDLKFKQYNFNGTCQNCKTQVTFKIDDRPLKTPDAIKFIRWQPERIDIDYDPLTGESIYYISVDPKIKQGLVQGSRKIYERTPLIYIEALKKKRKIQLDSNNLYHFKRPTLADEDMSWGKPVLLPALGIIWYMQTLRRGNEAIASEHIIPHRAIFPAGTGNLDPYSQVNLTKWRSQVEAQLEKWKEDPNHIGIFPIPMGMQSMGGDAKSLNVTPELKFLEESVINALGVPIEFVKGGVNWTGSSISLRIVENHFLSYREHLLDFLNYFMIPKVAEFLKYPTVAVEMKKFKMADDTESKQLAIQLNQLEKISDSKLLEDFGYDYDRDKEAKLRDIEFRSDLSELMLARQSRAQGKALVVQMNYQAQGEKEYLDTKATMREKLFADEIANENAKVKTKSENLIEKYTYEVMSLPEEQQIPILEKMYAKIPNTAMAVVNRIKDSQAGVPLVNGTKPPADNRAVEAEQEKNKVKKVEGKKDKSKAQTRGNP